MVKYIMAIMGDVPDNLKSNTSLWCIIHKKMGKTFDWRGERKR